MIKFDLKARKRAIRDLLVDMKGRLDCECKGEFNIEFSEDANWKGNEFKFNFNIFIPHVQMNSNEYDLFIELSDYAKRMFSYLMNPEAVDVVTIEGNSGLEVEIVGKTNND